MKTSEAKNQTIVAFEKLAGRYDDLFRAPGSVPSAVPCGKSLLTPFVPAMKSWRSIAEREKTRSFFHCWMSPLLPVMCRKE